MSNEKLGCKIDLSEFADSKLDENQILFAEDQSRYVISIDSSQLKEIRKKAEKKDVTFTHIGKVFPEKISINSSEVEIAELIKINEAVFENKFS